MSIREWRCPECGERWTPYEWTREADLGHSDDDVYPCDGNPVEVVWTPLTDTRQGWKRTVNGDDIITFGDPLFDFRSDLQPTPVLVVPVPEEPAA